MANAFISLKRLLYDDLAWRVEISASNGYFSGVQDFYTYPENLDALGADFYKFPQSIQDEVRFELGDRTGKWAYFVLVRAFLFDSVGHAAIEFAVDNNAMSIDHAQTSFFIRTEVAAINNLGQQLRAWVVAPDKPLTWSPHTT
ncbi:hypothetical protein IQ265_22535 [Nodosilinea sp. LEGE 06152]|uniref:hypothetical protein n=1 Tax=Nodosilinea sp. LEGE 06152 TaxID=2777966 RepID=UPI00187E7557|nr:hypothetical protein [Nodosilinea sp. LEGE 06152]MBE9159588.1 hypothetical protein [Nodosilinea sp. LEGE 06152]